MALYVKVFPSASPFQGVQVFSSFPSTELKTRINVKVVKEIHLRASTGLPWYWPSCSRRKLYVQPAVAVVSHLSESKVELQEAKQSRPQNKMESASVSSPISKPKSRPRKKKATEEGEAHIDEVEAKDLQSVQKMHEGHLFRYSDVVPNVCLQQFDDDSEVSAALAKYVAQTSKVSIKDKGSFTIALSGGSLVKALTKLIDEWDIEWSKWHVFWVDERVVPLNHEDSNYKLATESFLSKVPILKDQVYSINYSSNANMVARSYAGSLRGAVKTRLLRLDSTKRFPCFDLILLGIGPDGHVASLFPNSVALAEEDEWVVGVLGSPKPPPQRISLTLPCINAASHVAFVVCGSSKAEVLQRALERPALPGALPAQMVRPSNGELKWFVDKNAASLLSMGTWNDPKQFPAVNYSAEKKLPMG